MDMVVEALVLEKSSCVDTTRSTRGRDGGRFANFQCQICVNFSIQPMFVISGLMFCSNLTNHCILLI